MRKSFILFLLLVLCVSVSAKEYSDSVDKYFLEDDTFSWSPEHKGVIDRIAVDGEITGDGMVRVTIIRGGRQYEIFSRSLAEKFLISDYVELSEGTDIGMTLMYSDGNWDVDNDGKVDTSGGVDFSIEPYFFGLFDENYLCTAWDVFNIEEESYQTSCYGSSTCCSFLGYESSLDSWDNDYVVVKGKDGAGDSNVVLSRIVYYNVTHVSYSNYDALEAHFIDRNLEGGAQDFSELFSSKNNLLRITVEDGTILHLKSIDYTTVDAPVVPVVEEVVFDNSTVVETVLPVVEEVDVAKFIEFNESFLVSAYTTGRVGFIESNESFESWMLTSDSKLSFKIPLSLLDGNLSRLHFVTDRELHPPLSKNDGKFLFYDVNARQGKFTVLIDDVKLTAKEDEILYAAPIRPLYYLIFSIFVVFVVFVLFGLKRTALFEFYTDAKEFKAHMQVKEIHSVLERMKKI